MLVCDYIKIKVISKVPYNQQLLNQHSGDLILFCHILYL